MRVTVALFILLFAARAAAQGESETDSASALPVARMLRLPSALTTLLIARSPEVAAQRAAVIAAQARSRATGFAPSATLVAETEEVPGGLNLGRANSRVSLERELLTGGRRRAARALGRVDVVFARAVLLATVQRTLASASRSYAAAMGWSAIQRRLAGEDSLLASADVSLRTRFAAGQARYADVLRIRTERLRVESGAASALAEAKAARFALDGLAGITIGKEAGDGPSRTRDASATVLDSLLSEMSMMLAPDTLPTPPSVDSLLAASAAARAGEATVATAQAARGVVLADQRPRITAYLGGQRFLQEGQGFTFGPVFGATVSLPFTARRANEASLIAAEQGIVTAQAERTATLISLRAELAGAIARYQAARERWASYSGALLRGAREEREAALASYRGGELTLLELIDFERALAQAEMDRIHAAIDASDALANLVAPSLTVVEPPVGSGSPTSFNPSLRNAP